MPVKDFKVNIDDQDISILDAPLQSPKMNQNSEDIDFPNILFVLSG